MPNISFSQALLDWYDNQGRKNLPWRQDITPYRVWVSEIMLQQTQVKTVIAYFLRFMAAFPSLPELAAAKEDQVLYLWTGLGYYSRARNLHSTAKIVMHNHAGIFPNTLTGLQALPGIGRSTAGAILAIAMKQRAAILDGNVRRILSRYHAVSGAAQSKAVTEKLWQLAAQHTPDTRTDDYTQAIMDLGATVCTRSKPECRHCPLMNTCKAYQSGQPTAFPQPKIRKKIAMRTTRMLMIYDPTQHAVLLEKRPPLGIWGGLWSLPECALEDNFSECCQDKYAIALADYQELPTFKHVFTHFQLQITPHLITVREWSRRVMDSRQQVWYKLQSAVALGLASPVKRLLERLSAELTVPEE